MVFACQMNSYSVEFESKVISCSEVVDREDSNSLSEGTKYEVILEDTILFPEGGGQPDDRGTIDGIPVNKVFRRGARAIHLIDEQITIGTNVKLTVNWNRRFDHMQQHSGQHLITAIAESAYGFQTTSWNLGECISFIELDTDTITHEQQDHIEKECNARIRDHLPVSVTLYEPEATELQNVRSRVLPDDHAGPVRVVSIQGIDNNTCCGTHVSNLSHLQIVKLMYVEKGKKNKSNLYFLVGDRVLRFVAESVKKDKQLTTILNGGPDSHVELTDKVQKSLKISLKNEGTLMRDLASLEAQRFKNLNPRPKLFILYRREGNADFMNTIVKEINDKDVLIFLTVGEDKGAGQLLMCGEPTLVADLGPRVLEIMDGKGSVKGNRLNGKVKDFKQRLKAEKFLIEKFNETSST